MTNPELVSSRAMNRAPTNESSDEGRLSRWVFVVAAIYFLLHTLTAHGLVANLRERTVRLESRINGHFHP